MTVKKKTINQARGNSRAAQNKKIRRDALREQLMAKKYIDRLHLIAEGKDPGTKRAYKVGQLAKVKLKADIYMRLLNKCLPSLKSVDLPLANTTLTLDKKKGVDEYMKNIMGLVTSGQITPEQGKDLTYIFDAYVNAVEIAGFDKRLKELEQRT